jgi:hypothetical protein
MYFSFIPNIEYDKKPIQYPFSESDFVVAKNFFRRYQVNPDVFSYSVYFKKYAIQDGDRLDTIAEAAYGNSFYDWVIALTNNMINPLFDLPLSSDDLRKYLESKYDDPYSTIKHYEVISNQEQIEAFGKVIIQGGTIVDETFYNSSERYIVGTLPQVDPTVETIPINKVIDTRITTNIQEFNGTYIAPNGTGVGSNGGFAVGPHLKFGNIKGGVRWATLKAIDATNFESVEGLVIRGNDTNGGEVPDIAGEEELRLQYQVGGTDPDEWITIGVIVPTTSEGSNAGDEFNLYSINLPEGAKQNNTFFRLYQISSSGPSNDHYGIRSIEFKGSYEKITPLDYEVIPLDQNSYIIDGVYWKYDGQNWTRKISTGVKYNINNIITEIPGQQLCQPVYIFEYEEQQNEKKREIYLLKPSYLDAFLTDFRKTNLYGKSSDFINNRLKRTGI